MANNKTKKKNSGSTGIWALLLPGALGVAATAAAAVAAALIFGKLAYNTDDPLQYAPVIGTVALYLSVFLGGLCSNLWSGRHFGATVLHSVAVSLIMITVGLVAGVPFEQNILLKLLVLPCSLLGGALCYLKIPKKKKPKFKGRSK